MLYLYGLRLAAKLLLRGKLSRALRFAIYPVNYWRNAEFAAALAAIKPKPGDRILDVGSPKLLSLYLASRRGANIEATDLHDYFIADYTRLRHVEHLSKSQYELRAADGRQLPYPNASFDKTYAISVVEHIPDCGDTQCLQEMARVVRPGGHLFITVPFAPQAREEFRAPNYYWATPTCPGLAKPSQVFYQRRYDEPALRQRLIGPSGLRLQSLSYIGERVLTQSDQHQLSDYLPPWTGPLHPLFAAAFLTPPSPDWKSLKKPLCAVIVLRKD